MSLLDGYRRRCVISERTQTPDGEGGRTVTVTDGESFDVFLAPEGVSERIRAEGRSAGNSFSALAGRDAPVRYGCRFRDAASGVEYRVTSDPEMKKTPEASPLGLIYFTAERLDAQDGGFDETEGQN